MAKIGFTVTLEGETVNKVKKLKKEMGVSMAETLRTLIEEALEARDEKAQKR